MYLKIFYQISKILYFGTFLLGFPEWFYKLCARLGGIKTSTRLRISAAQQV